jgi:hypothetical protein
VWSGWAAAHARFAASAFSGRLREHGVTAKRLWVRDRLAVLSDLSVTGVNLLGVILRSLAWAA